MAGQKPQATPEQIADFLEKKIVSFETSCAALVLNHSVWKAKKPRPPVDQDLLLSKIKNLDGINAAIKALPKQIDVTTGKFYTTDCSQMKRLESIRDQLMGIVKDLHETSALQADSAHVMPGAPGRAASASASSGLEADVAKLHI